MLSYERVNTSAAATPPSHLLDLDNRQYDHQHDHVNHDPCSSLHHRRPIFPDAFSNIFQHYNPSPLYHPHFELLSSTGTPWCTDEPNRVGWNYSSACNDVVSQSYRQSRAAEPANWLKCQAVGCQADLRLAKLYHRRHKVCEFHSKATAVNAAGLTQRFCQQCSRFHVLSEFDDGKRSCRKRLADHNRRRRKSNQSQPFDHTTSESESSRNS